MADGDASGSRAVVATLKASRPRLTILPEAGPRNEQRQAARAVVRDMFKSRRDVEPRPPQRGTAGLSACVPPRAASTPTDTGPCRICCRAATLDSWLKQPHLRADPQRNAAMPGVRGVLAMEFAKLAARSSDHSDGWMEYRGLLDRSGKTQRANWKSSPTILRLHRSRRRAKRCWRYRRTVGSILRSTSKPNLLRDCGRHATGRGGTRAWSSTIRFPSSCRPSRVPRVANQGGRGPMRR
jgi:hypothetical protein